MAKKTFKDLEQVTINKEESPALAFITEPFEEADKKRLLTSENKKKNVETKSKRLNLLVKPSIYEDLEKIATMKQTSVNDLINRVLEDYNDKEKDLIDTYNNVFNNRG